MDKVIVYKNGTTLKDTFQKVRLSQKRPYTLQFVIDTQSLQLTLRAETKALLYYFCDNLSQKDRVIIRNIVSTCAGVDVCLCTNEAFALDAWKLNVFHFEEHPVDGRQILSAYKKHTSDHSQNAQAFTLKTNEGIIKLDHGRVNYLSANGNYTFFNLVGGKQLLMTRQLNKYDDSTEDNLNMKRLHRSYIFNMKNIQNIKGKEIRFYKTESPLAVSNALAIKIRKELLGSK